MATQTSKASGAAAAAAGANTAAGAGGTGPRIRMYRVGFGDFFLLSVPTGAGGAMAHVLVDCGVHAHDLGVMPAAVRQLKADPGGALALVIIPHRHPYFFSVFGSSS